MVSGHPYKVRHRRPLIWPILRLFFPAKWDKVAITFNGVIYSKKTLPDNTLAHELVHLKQQGNHPWKFLWKYLFNKDFRFLVELEAYKEECRFVKNSAPADLPAMIELASEALSSPLYGSIVSQETVKKLLSDI